MNTLTDTTQTGAPLPVRAVAFTRPFHWLRSGWNDLRHNPGPSLAYGLLVSALGAVILTMGRHPYVVAAAISGFLLVGPLMTTGLCELSRLRERGERAHFDASLYALTRNRSALIALSATLVAIGVVWFALSTVMLVVALGSAGPPLTSTVWGGVLWQLTPEQSLSYAIVGGILAVIVFARSVVAVPLIIDRDADASTATKTSLKAMLSDFPAMVVWAALIVLLTAVGFATFLIGMVVVFPLLGHATWHAYRDLLP